MTVAFRRRLQIIIITQVFFPLDLFSLQRLKGSLKRDFLGWGESAERCDCRSRVTGKATAEGKRGFGNSLCHTISSFLLKNSHPQIPAITTTSQRKTYLRKSNERPVFYFFLFLWLYSTGEARRSFVLKEVIFFTTWNNCYSGQISWKMTNLESI